MRNAIIAIIIIILAAIAYVVYTGAQPQSGGADTGSASTTVTVSTSTLSESTPDFTIDAKYPQFGIPAIDMQIATTVAQFADALKAQAATDSPSTNGFRPYAFYGSYDDVYIGDKYISARLLLAQDTGGAHPLPVVVGLDFDRTTGTALGPQDALSLIGMSLDELASSTKAKLTEQLGDSFMFQEGADPSYKNYETFVIDKKNVTFVFQPYQVAAYAVGAPEVSFPRVK